MAIVVEGTPTIYESASTASAVIPYPTGITAGEVLVAIVGTSTVTAPTTVPSGWTLTKAQNGDNAISVSIWHKVASGSESGSETFSTTSGRTTGHMFRLSGVDTTTPIDATAVGAGAPVQSTFTMPTITTATDGALLIHGIVLNASNRTTNDIVTLSGTTLVAITADAGANGGRVTGAYSETRATAGATGTRVWSKTGATTLQWAGITAAFKPSAGGGSTVSAPAATATASAKVPVVTNGTGPTPVLNRCVQGIPGTTTHRITVNVTDAGTARIKAGTNSAVTTGVVWGDAITVDGNGNAELTISGLTANTAYYYRIAMTNSVPTEFLDTWTAVGEFKTDLDGQLNFTVGFGSCTNNTDSASMSAIATKKPDLFLHLGDEYYADGSGTGVANFRTKMSDKITATNFKAVYRTSGANWVPSDHDAMNNNGNYAADATGWTNWNQVYREMKPTTGLPGSMGVYRTFKRGRVRFIALDRRSFASAAGDTDNSSKTSLGTTQKQWFKDQLDAATEPVIIVQQGEPWIISSDPGDDGWGGYITERDELASYISGTGKNVIMLAGDMHAVAAEDGSGSPGGVPVFQASPFYQNASIKGGPYDVGPYPASGTTVVQQYGWLDVTDSGSSISVVYTGYSSDNTQRVTLTKTYSVPVPATVVSVAATATATDIVPVVTAAATVAGVASTATATDIVPAVSAGQIVTTVRAQGSSTAIAPAVSSNPFVAHVRAQASSTAIAPTVLGAQTATVVSPVFAITSQSYAPTVTTIGALTSVLMSATAGMAIPVVVGGDGIGNSYSLFTDTPQLAADQDTTSVNLGTEFYVTDTGWLTQVRYLQPVSGGTTTVREATLWSTNDGVTGTLVAGPFTMSTIPGPGEWGIYNLPTPFQLTPNQRYRIVIRHPDGRYAATPQFFNTGDGGTTLTQGILVRPNAPSALNSQQGSYNYDSVSAFTNSSFGNASYYSDVTVVDADPSGQAGATAPAATATSSAIAPSVSAGQVFPVVASSATAAAVAPSFTGGVVIAGATATATSAMLNPSVAAFAGTVISSPTMLATATEVAPTVTAVAAVVAVRAQGSSLAVSPVVTGDTNTVAVRAQATATLLVPGVTAGGVAAVTAVKATASASAKVPAVAVIVGIGAPAMSASSTMRTPSVSAQVAIQGARATASAQAQAPVASVIVAIAALKMTATAIHRNPSVNVTALMSAVVAIATAVAHTPHLGGDKELYLKDGTRLRPFMLIGGILVPVDPKF